MGFKEEYARFFSEFGESRKMVLSTSLNDAVTSRMMSVIAIDEKIYFQTDNTLRKYKQIMGNPNVSLCIDNIQIDGLCKEAGLPLDNTEFSQAFRKNFLNAYTRYTGLKNERLFAVQPTFIERWLYIDGVPYTETFDVQNQKYSLSKYAGV